MKRKRLKCLTGVLIASMVLGMAAPIVSYAEGDTSNQAVPMSEEGTEEGKVTDYATFLADLKVLESYAETYAKEHKGETETELVLNYIRTGVERYLDSNWTLLAGEEKTAFTAYVAAQDLSNGTTASDLRNIEEFKIPNGQTVDFGHMFGCMNITYYMKKTNASAATIYADLSGWGGDICDIMTFTKGKVSGDIETMTADIRENYLGVDDPEVHTFGILDIYGDLDAFYIMDNISSSKKISAVMSSYFNTKLTDKSRASYFLKHRFPGKGTKDEIRKAIYNAYAENSMLANLETSRGLGAEDADLRIACNYAFADYLFDLTGVIMDKEANDYYTVFSSQSSNLAPGITQQIKQATTADNKQIVYYVATADIGRSDVDIYANFKDNKGGQPWGMQRVTDQMAAAQAKHSDPADTENYIPNYNTIVGVNADFYNMSTGEPSGALIMEGVQYHDQGGAESFFGILKDGTPVIGARSEWNTYKADLQEAVGGSIFLVKDGKSVVNNSGSYYVDRASRTCVGITADNKVVLMVLDGRQEPVSAGGTANEMAQIMLDAGCVIAINLDGGGSTTYAAKSEGSDEVSVINRPSDGYERSVSSSLMVVSTAKSSTEFDHALVTTKADYLTVGTSVDIEVTGVSATGNAAALPSGATLTVSDETVGTIENGVFMAASTGDVTVKLVLDGEVLGSKTLHVVVPDGIEFTKKTINAVYGVACEMPIKVTYQGNQVAVNKNDVMFGFMIEGEPQLESEAGVFDGFSFIGDESSKIRVVKAIALLNIESDEIFAMSTINLYKQDEAVFDFDKATGGDDVLGWVRQVSNAKTVDEETYYIIDPAQDMKGTYTFAVDMSKIPVPDKIEPMLGLLPGGDSETATAWSFLMQLAERVSVLTNVEVELQTSKDFDIDITNLKVVNDYFELTSANYDAATHTLKMTFNFIDQTAAIAEDEANALFILSGLRLIACDDAKWNKDQIAAELSGTVSYDIYLRSSAVYEIASEEANQEAFGLYPFINPNDELEKGAHFMSEFATFTDTYRLDRTNKQGWMEEDGNLYYYKDNAVLTGIQKLPGYQDESKSYYYDLGTDGVSKGKVSGLFDLDHAKYYAENGVLKSGWKAVTGAGGSVQNYYFDPNTYKAVNGSQTIGGYHYEFTDYVLTRGELVKSGNNTRYMWAGSFVTQQWMTIDGKKYYFRSSYNAATGIYAFNIDGKNVHYVFDENGVWLEDLTGMYTDAAGDTYWVEQGIKNAYPGLICVDGKYYYFTYERNNKLGVMVKGGTYWVTKTNGLMNEANYQFAEDGHMLNPKPNAGAMVTWVDEDGTVLKEERLAYDTMPVYGKTDPTKAEDARYTYQFSGWSPKVTAVSGDVTYTAQYTNVGKSGLCVEGEDTYWIKDGVNVEYPGLIKVKNENGKNQYYYFGEDGKAVKNVPVGGKDYWVEKTNGLLPQWGYYFDENGVIIHDDLYQNGIQSDADGVLCYYIDGIKAHMGMMRFGKDYYYVRSNGQLVVGRSYYCTNNNNLKPEGTYAFDESGKMILPDLSKNGIIEENGSLYYYENGELTYAGVIEIDGAYYYVKTSGEVVHGKSYWISKTNGLLEEKSYTFGDDGRIIFPDTSKNGIVEENGSLYYYENGKLTYAGVIEIDGAYYYVKTSGEVIHGRDYWISKTNGLLKEKSYTFDEDGKILL